MNELQVFSNPDFGAIRTLLIDNQPWAVGKDVAGALGYKNPSRDINRHVDPEDRQNYRDGSFDSPRGLTIINESGLYSLILSSKLPTAKQFKRWVTSEVLPAIRATGSYTIPENGTRVLTPDDYLRAASIMAGCKNERLPYVVGLLKRAGIDISLETRLISPRSGEKDTATALLLNRACGEYGLSLRALERVTGIHTTQFYRIRQGKSFPNAERAAIIRDAVKQLVPEMEIEEETK